MLSEFCALDPVEARVVKCYHHLIDCSLLQGKSVHCPVWLVPRKIPLPRSKMAVPKQCAERCLEKTPVSLQLLLYQGEGLLKKWLKEHLCLSGCISSWEKKRPSISRAVNLGTPATTKSHFNLFLQFLYTLPSVYCKDVLTSKIPVRQIALHFEKC